MEMIICSCSGCSYPNGRLFWPRWQSFGTQAFEIEQSWDQGGFNFLLAKLVALVSSPLSEWDMGRSIASRLASLFFAFAKLFPHLTGNIPSTAHLALHFWLNIHRLLWPGLQWAPPICAVEGETFLVAAETILIYCTWNKLAKLY